MSEPDRVNLLSDAWALAQAKTPPYPSSSTSLKDSDPHCPGRAGKQIMTSWPRSTACSPINRTRAPQQYARSILRPASMKLAGAEA